MYERFQTFTVLTLKISRCIHRIKTEEMAEFNLKSTHVSCLYYLYQKDALTATELCEICEEDKSYVSHSIRFLEENGYIRCSSTAKKRYKATFSLTEKGYDIASRIAQKIDAVMAPASQGLTEEERNIFYRGLVQISDNLQKICEGYDTPTISERKSV